MKGVILSINPAVALVDISHALPRRTFARAHGAGRGDAWFPAETIHVAVVDPGVGTARRLSTPASASSIIWPRTTGC